MAAHSKDLCDAMNGLSVKDDVRLKQLGLNDDQQSKLKKIANDYDSVFSWDIKLLTGNNQNLMTNLVDKIREKYEMVFHKDDEFNLNKFYLKLIIIYELYMCGSYDESLKEIESVVNFMESCKYDESNEQYLDAFIHIVRATNAYISISLNHNSENIMKNIKPSNCLNRAEKAAICAVKARVFMEYPPKGNDIALKFADEACNLHSTEPEWIIIWLKAKGRVRRYYKQFGMPDEVEIDAAEMLCTTKTKPRLLIQASKLFMEVAYCHKLKFNQNESNKYYKLSFDLTLKAVELAKDDTKQLYSCLLTFIDYPKHLQPKTVIDNVIQKLSSVKNSRVDQVLGKYYLKHMKDYEKARTHLSRAMAGGHFGSSLQLIKVECLLQPVENVPLVQSLNMIYDVFTSPKRRLIILSQILIYYHYYENNSKEIMHYLKLYMDQDIDDTFKKRHLIFAHPLFKVQHFRIKQFLNVLSFKLKTIKNSHEWTSQEKEIIDDTIERFYKMSKLKLYENQYVDNIKTGAHKQHFDSKSNKNYPNRKPYPKHNDKQKRLTETVSNHQPCTSKSIDRNDDHEKYSALNKESHKEPYHKEKTKQYVRKPSVNLSNKISESMLNLNDSKSINSKLKKFEPKHNSLDNIHVVSVENNAAITSTSRMTRGRSGNLNRFPHPRGGKKWPVTRQSNFKNDQKFKNNDNICNKKPSVDKTEVQLHDPSSK